MAWLANEINNDKIQIYSFVNVAFIGAFFIYPGLIFEFDGLGGAKVTGKLRNIRFFGTFTYGLIYIRA